MDRRDHLRRGECAARYALRLERFGYRNADLDVVALRRVAFVIEREVRPDGVCVGALTQRVHIFADVLVPAAEAE